MKLWFSYLNCFTFRCVTDRRAPVMLWTDAVGVVGCLG